MLDLFASSQSGGNDQRGHRGECGDGAAQRLGGTDVEFWGDEEKKATKRIARRRSSAAGEETTLLIE